MDNYLDFWSWWPFTARKRIKELLSRLDDLEKKKKTLVLELGGNTDRLKNLLIKYGGIEKIENLIKSSLISDVEQKTISELEKKYGSLRGANIKLQELENIVSEKQKTIERIYVEIGGADRLQEIRDLRDKYGSFSVIQRKLSSLGASSSGFSDVDIQFIDKCKRHGSFDEIINKLDQFETKEKKLFELEHEHKRMSKDFNDLKTSLESERSKLQSIILGIGGESNLPEIKTLRDKYGSFSSIISNLDQFESRKQDFVQIKERLSILEKDNEILKKKLEEKDLKYQNIIQRIGGEEELQFVESLKKSGWTLTKIKETMDLVPELRDKYDKMKDLESCVGEDTWVLDQLKEKLKSRQKEFSYLDDSLGDNFLKLGEKFRDDCEKLLLEVFDKHDPSVRLYKEKDRKDLSVSFSIEGGKKFDVIIECKSIEQYYKNSPIVLTPAIRDKDIESIKKQLEKAEKQLSSNHHKKLRITVISVPYERFREYGIENEIVFSENKGELKNIIISQSCLKPLLLSLRVLCRNYTPELDFEKHMETYSNPEYVEMIFEIAGKIKEWEEMFSKLSKGKAELDKRYRIFSGNLDKIDKLMGDWIKVINNHCYKASSWNNQLESSLPVEVEYVSDGENSMILESKDL